MLFCIMSIEGRRKSRGLQLHSSSSVGWLCLIILSKLLDNVCRFFGSCLCPSLITIMSVSSMYFSWFFKLHLNISGWSLPHYTLLLKTRPIQSYAKKRFKIRWSSSSSGRSFIVIRDNSVFPFSCHLELRVFTRQRPAYLKPSVGNDKRSEKATWYGHNRSSNIHSWGQCDTPLTRLFVRI